ncbi:MAG TPA: phosphate ABC transporter permease subunit PstC [Pseudomonas xinjiangensis]|uniref:Phosphate transport system permease protein n=2 Tax=root TaxID=1 RepID=A0A7V1BSL5_9GAMM|nr:phosphate ABC transporter permease subunit PstC [Halopseudomonas xinjiangensis]HEC47010.1 phosphate ABC transporter permease subunit PstC [Halopseudomonas xinjiangensis]
MSDKQAGQGANDRLHISPHFLRRREITNEVARYVLMAAAAVSVFVTIGIVYILLSESLVFFETVSVWEFVSTTSWTPLFAEPTFGIWPLLSGTLVVSGIALAVAVPAGLVLAVYLSEFAPANVRETIKPILELLEGVPTVVYGFFALLLVTPLLQIIFPQLPGFNMLAPGLVIGIMILPYITSLSEDAMRAVPNGMREGAYALGYSKYHTAVRVVVPAAISGITAACILAMSRAVGETMVVAIAAGQMPNFTFNPMEGAATITTFIVQVTLGDARHGSIAYQSIFAAGLVLFLLTLLFNLIGFFLRRRFRQAY